MTESSPTPPPKKRCIIYLDAFNWYFGIFMHRPAWKWLNVQSFKKTDVNIAVNLLDDALRGLTDSMVIVSGDSDLEPAVEWV